MMKKDLYKASSTSELFSMIENIGNATVGKTVIQIISSEKKLLDHAELMVKEGDEENAYILYGRYMKILSTLQKRSDYAKQKDFIRKMLGGNAEQQRIMEKMEQLSDSLRERYDQKKKLTLESKNTSSEPVNSLPKQVKTEIRHSITCHQLYEMIEKESSKFLIIDCRQENNFQESKIIFNFQCNVPEHLCSIGMTVGKVQDKLPNESKVFWEMRKSRPIIVFVDWFSISFTRNSPIWHLKNILMDWDQELDKKPEMILLEGGYDRWLTTYPSRCTDPHVKSPKPINNISSPSMDDIEYPNVDDIMMKDQSINTSLIPTIDRTTKNHAMKSYDEKNLSQSELLERKELLMNKSIQNNMELIRLENDYSNIEADEGNQENLSSQQDLLYKIYELHTKQKDVELEGETIEEELKIVKNDPVKPSEKSKVEDLENRLKMKADEQKEIKLQALSKVKAREEALEKARQLKPKFDSPIKPSPRKSELILSPRNLNHQSSIPRIDRASKPLSTSNQTFYDTQDFSPVFGKVERGLTGLKNLGNTCYMNSIIQCLSHTLSLTQFILENAYEKYINRSNHTRGHIVRTLAALIKMLWTGDCKYISSKHLKAVIGEQDNLFFGCEQQDAHEFLIMLIDWLQSDLQTIHMDTMIENASEKAWLEYTKAKESFILHLFYGQIKSTLKCAACGEESATFDTFSNLSLDLPSVDIDRNHLSQCFNSYFHGERISGWNCPKCKIPRDAIKKCDISKLPPVLIIHLKRFCADTFSFRKKTVYIDFPLTNLDMLPYVAPKERIVIANTTRTYNLYAISNHYGTLESGHYTAFCLNAKQNKWYKFDDQNVSAIDRSDVKSSAAYVLFYTCLPDNNFIM